MKIDRRVFLQFWQSVMCDLFVTQINIRIFFLFSILPSTYFVSIFISKDYFEIDYLDRN